MLVADLFCGAGGSSTGARRALERRGKTMKLVAVNHWSVAIETHSKNHPDAEHFCANAYRLAPLDAVPGGELDLLMASPTCTFHSRARGGKPTSWGQRYGRMTPTQVVRWVTDLKVRCLIVENVPEFVDWGPVHRAIVCPECEGVLAGPGSCGNEDCGAACTRVWQRGLKRVIPEKCRQKATRCRPGRPCKRKVGVYFRTWLRKLRTAGFQVDHRVLNAADYGDATTRRRFFLVGRSDGVAPQWPDPTHSRDGSSDLFGESRQRWRPAREIIDWSLRGRSIFTRKRPLSPKTLARIHAGAVKFGWPQPLVEMIERHMAGEPVKVADRGHLIAGDPLVFQVNQGHGRTRNIRSVDSPMQTVVTRASFGVAEPLADGEPFVTVLRRNADGRSVDRPVPTVTAGGTHIGLAEPFVSAYNGNKNGKPRAPRSIDEPLATQPTANRFAIAEPLVVRSDMHKSNAMCVRSPDDPLATVTTRGGFAVAEPFVFGNRTNNVPKEVGKAPLPTATTSTGGGMALVLPQHGTNPARPVSVPAPVVTTTSRGIALVIPQGGGGVARKVEAPVPTIACDGAHALVAPYYGQSAARPASRPLPTITTRDRFGLVTPVTHAGGKGRARDVEQPLPTVTGAHRGELGFVTAAFGERAGQAPRVRSVDEPAPTICAKGRVNLVQGAHYDVLFRMLQPHELAAAMGFDSDETAYEFCGNKTEVTKQIGNAVAVGTATALVGALMGVA